jgi:hypothetical protein
MEIDNLKKKYKNLTQGTKILTLIITTKPIDTPFRDNDIELLIKQHPNEKKIKNIEYLIIRIRPPYNQPALFIKNIDNDKEDDVSYKSCLKNLFGKYDREENNKDRILRTFRDSISNSKKKNYFLFNYDNGCENCSSFDNINIDHYNLSFQKILDNFLSSNSNIKFLSLKVFENANNIFEFEDKNITEKWIEYHDSRATFRILCKSCNSSNGSYGYKKNKKLYTS